MLRLTPDNLFLIVSPARAASTALRYALDDFQNVACHGELFGETRIDEDRISNKVANPKVGIYHRTIKSQDFLNRMFPSNDYVFGVKWLYKHFFNVDNLQFIEAFASHKPKIIFLWRRNLIQRFYSDILLRIRMGYLKKQYIESINIAMVRQDCEKQILQAKYISKLFLPERIMCVDFEDLISTRYSLNEINSYINSKSISSQPLYLEKDSRSKGAKLDDIEMHLKEKFQQFYTELDEYQDQPHPHPVES